MTLTALSRPCSNRRAACGDDGKPLARDVAVEIPAWRPPLTASFDRVPGGHDGTDFSVRLVLSEEPQDGITAETVRDDLLSVTGGAILSATPWAAGAARRWILAVDPDNGTDAVTVAVNATTDCGGAPNVCTEDGRMLGVGAAVTVNSVPSVLNFRDAEATEGEPLVFTAELTRAVEEDVSFTWSTVGAGASEGSDYTGAVTQATIAAGTTSATMTVETHADIEAEASEIVEIRLTEGPAGGGVAKGDVIATGLILDGPPPPFTARFEGMPETHDGGSFTFDLVLSHVPKNGAFGLFTHTQLFAVTNGTATSMRRIGSRQRWRVSLDVTDATQDVTITMNRTTDCDAGPFGLAICTEDGRKLDNDLSATVTPEAPPELRIADAPDTDEGDDMVFKVTLSRSVSHDVPFTWMTFTPAPSNDTASAEDYTAVPDGAGTIPAGETEATLSVETKNDAWDDADENVWVRISVAEDVDAVVADAEAVGKITQSVPAAYIDGDASATEGSTLWFKVRLTHVTHRDVSVHLSTSDGTATGGTGSSGDYTTQTSAAVTITKGNTGAETTSTEFLGKVFGVPTTDDDVDEGDETMTVTITTISPTGAATIDPDRASATGTIRNDGPVPVAWLARFGRSLGTQVTQAIGDRLRDERAASRLTLGGVAVQFAEGRLDEGAARGLAGLFEGDSAPRDGAFRLDFADGGETPGLTAWGRVDGLRFEGTEESIEVGGEVVTGIVGVDRTWGDVLLGLAVSRARGKGTWEGASGGGIEQSMTSLHPYARYAVSDRLDVWGTAGFGRGRLEVATGEGETMEAGSRFLMGAAGARGVLLKADGWELAGRTDVMMTRTTSGETRGMRAGEAEAHRFRLVLEGSRNRSWDGGRRLDATLEIGLRHDWGDAETGTGAELGGRFRYADPALGLAMGAGARILAVHEASGYRERGASATFSWDPRPETRRGPTLSLKQDLGDPSSGVDALFGRDALAGTAGDGAGSGSGRFEGTFGYGLPVFGGAFVGTPNLGLGLSDDGRDVRLGWRLDRERARAPDFRLSIDATRREPDGDGARRGHGVSLTGAFRW
ncbi:MAG: hypothetical protein F4Z60_09725 [Chloroflexi bacterium]|nr:hypothetical protein [Chloroflexota bacterium]